MENARSSRTDANAKRVRAGIFSGILGIVCNTLLAGAKIAVGALFGMLSVLADGVNNLTDCGSNAVSLIGFKVSGKPADKEHPFGHRRSGTGNQQIWKRPGDCAFCFLWSET